VLLARGRSRVRFIFLSTVFHVRLHSAAAPLSCLAGRRMRRTTGVYFDRSATFREHYKRKLTGTCAFVDPSVVDAIAGRKSFC
jgi:hypothetical protein